MIPGGDVLKRTVHIMKIREKIEQVYKRNNPEIHESEWKMYE